MRISIFYYFVISTVVPDSNAAALFDDMNWSNILHAFGLDDDDHHDHFLPMMTYTGKFYQYDNWNNGLSLSGFPCNACHCNIVLGYRNYNPQKRDGPIDFST